MKNIYLKILLCLLVVLALGCVLAGCNNSNFLDHYDHRVTFDYNYGNLDANCPTQYLGVMDNSLIYIQPGYKDSFRLYEIKGYFIEGWYTPQLDEEGNPIRDSQNFVKLDRKWDFANDKVTESIVLYAKLMPRVSLTIKDRLTGEVYSTITGEPGDVREKPSDQAAPKKDGYTFTSIYYTGLEGNDQLSWPYTFGEESQTVYVEFLEGTWTIVDSAAGFNNIVNKNKRANIYVVADLDFSETKWLTNISFNGKILGNGHKFSNIKIDIPFAMNKKIYGGLFEGLQDNARICDVSFENVAATFTSVENAVDIHVGMVAGKISSGAVLQNVTVQGTLTYTYHYGAVEAYALCANRDYNSENIIDCDLSQVELVKA